MRQVENYLRALAAFLAGTFLADDAFALGERVAAFLAGVLVAFFVVFLVAISVAPQ